MGEQIGIAVAASRLRVGCFLAVGVMALGVSCGGGDGGAGVGQVSGALSMSQDLAVTSVSAASRVRPDGRLSVTVVARNTGDGSWDPRRVKLAYIGDAGWKKDGDLALQSSTSPGQTGVFLGTLEAPEQVGIFDLSWRAVERGSAFGATASASVEVTCSDGVFCNGTERYANGKCTKGTNPCNDGVACTTDVCDEPSGLCEHALGPKCAACFAPACTPDCAGRSCGGDGCGGSCGTCPLGQACDAGACAIANAPGTCANPLPLLPPGVPLYGRHTVTGDTTGAANVVIPTCNAASQAPEQVYVFSIPLAAGTVGIDAQSHDFDTVLHLRKADCLDPAATVGCSDDAAPPGDYGSHIAKLLVPGAYYLIVDGFDDSAFGHFTLNLNFVAKCVPQCDGRFCGPDDGCGGDCGTCPPGQACSALSRCLPSPCTPDCAGKQCGDNGCGGSCGACKGGKLCVLADSTCKAFAACDHAKPVCAHKCSKREFCGSDCECHEVDAAMPDLVVNRSRLQNEILFDTLNVSPYSCTVVEDCVGGTGLRKLLRFSVEAVNQGQATLTVPPPDTRPDLFDFSPCHGHYHFGGFASYALLDKQGHVVLRGRKQAYCMEDTVRVDQGPNVACSKAFDCSNQGIQAGWSDLYGNALDCQWLDITDIQSGSYQLQVNLNPNRAFDEVTFDNNSATVPVTIP